MKIIIDNKGNKFKKRQINDGICYINMPENFFLFYISFFVFHTFFKTDSEFYPSENLKNNTRAFSFLKKRISFESEEKIYEIFLNRADMILKNLKRGKALNICIVSEHKDGRIFKLSEKFGNTVGVIYLMTDDENFYEAVSDYFLENYGITVCMRKMNEQTAPDLYIVLNALTPLVLTSLGRTICLCSVSDIKNAEILDDIAPCGVGDFSKIGIKKCQFMPENCTNFNLIWRNCAKTIDKTKK